jgi:hypothetical protein
MHMTNGRLDDIESGAAGRAMEVFGGVGSGELGFLSSRESWDGSELGERSGRLAWTLRGTEWRSSLRIWRSMNSI